MLGFGSTNFAQWLIVVIELSTSADNFSVAFSALLSKRQKGNADISAAVHAILVDVQKRGDAAVLEYTRRFDSVDLTATGLWISPAERDACAATAGSAAVAALELAATRIHDFHCHQKPDNFDYVDETGVRLGQKWTPIAAVGLYVPGGTATYSSSVLMNAIPAKIAGVQRTVMVVPTPGGSLNPLVCAAARIAGIDEIYRIGGAQAIGALAYGTATITSVDKIVGPGNAYVTAAKHQVFGQVGVDMIAGPSEIVVVADSTSNPHWIASDLISQAEHDIAAQAILITDNYNLSQQVAAEVNNLLINLPRADIARTSWNSHGAIIVVDTLDKAVSLVNALAPEHLELAVADPDALAIKVHHVGAIFLGHYTPEAIGDYVGGPNHVLPTARSARFSSGLSVFDFLKRTSFLSCSPATLACIGPAAITLAIAEGFHAHSHAVAVRLLRDNQALSLCKES